MANAEFNVIVSDIHHRISGVSATVRAIIPRLIERQSVALIATQPFNACKRWTLAQLFIETRKPAQDKPKFIWHVRRNNEMTWALIFKYIFRRNIHIVFTSAAIRKHSWWPRQLINTMDSIIATSEKAAGFMPSVCAVVPHGVDLTLFYPKDLDHHFDPEFDPNIKYIGIIGRVRSEKGTDLFVNSCIDVMKTQNDVKAVIIGKTTAKFTAFKNGLMQKIAAEGLDHRFIWLDEVAWEAMPDIYRGLDVVVSPAAYEGFGLVPLEAGASGCAVIATKTGAYEEIIVSERTGYLVEIGDQEGVTQHLQFLLTHPDELKLMQNAALTRVSDQFSLDNEVNAIENVYQTIWKNYHNDNLME